MIFAFQFHSRIYIFYAEHFHRDDNEFRHVYDTDLGALSQNESQQLQVNECIEQMCHLVNYNK